ncbi:hypothetical protein RRG08_020891 [Elysia crispata]|uniref:Uncharacterized protein n=1 Tax=Elysia crispata TaxID=231223 RepID=A0AAE1AIL2_9GAST|nr:hypothetical protein RRG08_020891 [Elysia crispata]
MLYLAKLDKRRSARIGLSRWEPSSNTCASGDRTSAVIQPDVQCSIKPMELRGWNAKIVSGIVNNRARYTQDKDLQDEGCYSTAVPGISCFDSNRSDIKKYRTQKMLQKC